MMKKVWLILLAVVLVFGLVMLGCSSDGGGDEKRKGTGDGEGEGEGSGIEGAYEAFFEIDDDKAIFYSDGMDDAESVSWDIVKAAKYLVVVSKNSSNLNGFGGTKGVLQGDGNSYHYTECETDLVSSWVSFTHTATDVVYIVIDLTALKEYDDFIKGTKGKVNVANWDISTSPKNGLGVQTGYFVVGDLTKPSGGVDLDGDTGFIVMAADLELNIIE
jgi:hypothetical protein